LFAIGTQWHYNAHQDPAFPFIWRDGIPLGGTHLDEDTWASYGLNPDHLSQEFAESPNAFWLEGTDHTNNKGRGIAEDFWVQEFLLASLLESMTDTF
jgi:hypothetical protein